MIALKNPALMNVSERAINTIAIAINPKSEGSSNLAKIIVMMIPENLFRIAPE